MKTIVYLCLLIGCFAATLTRAKSQPDWSWLLERTALPPRDLINDKQFIELLEKYGPRLKVDLGVNPNKKKNAAMEAAVLEAMTGEADPIQVLTPGTLVLSGCRATNCDEKGFVWIDVERRQLVMALIHFLFEGVRSTEPQVMYSAKSVACKKIPEPAVEAIRNWIRSKGITPKAFRCADR